MNHEAIQHGDTSGAAAALLARRPPDQHAKQSAAAAVMGTTPSKAIRSSAAVARTAGGARLGATLPPADGSAMIGAGLVVGVSVAGLPSEVFYYLPGRPRMDSPVARSQR